MAGTLMWGRVGPPLRGLERRADLRSVAQYPLRSDHDQTARAKRTIVAPGVAWASEGITSTQSS